MKTNTLLIGAFALLFSNAQAESVPGSASFERQTLQKTQSAAHWQHMANDIAAQVLETSDLKGQLIHIQTHSNSRFETVLKPFLETAMLNRGVRVASANATPSSSIAVQIRTDIVEHASTGDSAHPFAATFLSSGLLVIREAALSSPALGLLGFGALVDTARAANNETANGRIELLVTASIENNTDLLAREVNLYLIDSADVHLYEKAGNRFKVVGD